MLTASHVRGRLAPSPTGHLHLGNAWAFLLCWLAVRKADGTVILRMEDIDPDRSKTEFATDIITDLHWLGLDWDEGPDCGGDNAPYTQSEKLDRYAEVIAQLSERGLTYPCYCTRKELRSLASAPHKGEFGPAYPGTCLHLSASRKAELEAAGRRPSLRLHADSPDLSFHDRLCGDQHQTWEECGGDFPLRRSDGVISYQLAVAVDDIDQNVTLVMRGDDILHCTPRQVYLYKLLNARRPDYAHVPLVLDAEGERLAKRHKHFELRALREMGISAKAIIGYLGYRAGLLPEPKLAQAQELLTHFSLEKLPKQAIQLENDIEEILKKLSEKENKL
ncbi:tRNA glutamyl-Q(34) synthetase GluQRS [Desulfobaculum bizertense]|uniref:Glutamyl-tRNA synthetase n=1 Tax=Desulfobaculum bizertense DSM 18034 TaxID=1121442 RepID=A0A1T4VYB3_9BACT|nr:tRNA glutamyl-Q(34) synthetase GluQRS [Desulfobaculum bizertense]SKA69973.1 glutamyl-tRNA synthetase [Desulfobaculum bizertense DSM 18034]